MPSLQAIGLWSYWIIGGAALLEAYFVTGVVVPGTLVVDVGGALVRLGSIDFFDLVWFVFAGSAIGGELGYWTGRRTGTRLLRRWGGQHAHPYLRAEALFRRWGGVALVLGRFAGPASGLVPFAAAVSGMDARRFRLWNLASALLYALAHVSVGYAAGGVVVHLGPELERVALLAAAVAALLALIWLVSAQVRLGLPLLLAALATLRDAVLAHPTVAAWLARHPRSGAFVARRSIRGGSKGCR